MASPSSSPTSVSSTVRTVPKLGRGDRSRAAGSERSGGLQVPLVAALFVEAVGVADLDLALQVVEEVEAEVGLRADVRLQIRGLEAPLVGVAGVDEDRGPQLAHVRGKCLVSALDPQQRRAVFRRGELVGVADEAVGRIAAQEGAALGPVQED